MLPEEMQDDEQHTTGWNEEGSYLDRAEGDGDDNEESLADAAFFREAMQSYRSESLEWAQRRSAVMPVPRPASFWSWSQRTPGLVAGTAALALLVGAVSVRQHRVAGAGSNGVAFVQPSSQTLASDNLLLSSVDSALEQDPVPTEQELGLTAPPRPAALSGHAAHRGRAHGR